MKNFFTILLIINSLIVFSQETKDYNWDTVPNFLKTDSIENKDSYFYLKNNQTLEYYYDETSSELFIYQMVHYAIKLNDDRAIEDVNKVFISLNSVIDIIDLNARTISPNNKITEVNKENIREVENLEEKGNFKLFAIDGIEKGAIVEVIYKLKKKAFLFGNVVLQKTVPVYNAKFSIITPANLVFKTKTYNGIPIAKDTTYSGKRHQEFFFENIPALKEEKYSAYKANLIRLQFVYSQNINRQNSEMFTYPIAANRLFEYFYDFDKKSQKLIEKQLSKLKLKNLDKETKIIEIEKFVKNSIVIKENIESEEKDKISYILDNKITSKEGMVKILLNMYQVAGINHQLVVSCDRNDRRIDKELMSWDNLTDYLIYFPDTKKYLSPQNQFLRYPMYENQFYENYGLFLKKITIGEITSAVPEILQIPANSFENDFHNTFININLQPNSSSIIVNAELQFGGISGAFIQPYYHLIDDSRKNEVIDDLIKYIAKDAEIQTREVFNYDHNIPPSEKPFIIKSTLKINSIIENAGNDFLLKIGTLIGEQVEMYSTESRKTPVEITHAHQLVRKLTFSIPDGYSIKNLDSVIKNIEYGDNSTKTMGFISSYTLKDKIVTIDINEYYKSITYPKEQYEQFREVINAAADFNKVVLVFEKN